MAFRDLRRKVRKRLSELFEIPGDVMLDLPKITLVGNIQILVENHRGIIEYTPQRVRVCTGDGEVAVGGEDLILRNILPDELMVEGKIRTLSFN
ncbi:MAG TPA: sporulation protein YqfC [Bacillota bacterium]|nr:sporulation protein YqfC [Bacillota bacterium]